MAANDRQVAGDHYRKQGTTLQHWDLAVMFDWDYLQAQVIKYLMRWRDKNGVEDLRKAAHYLEKYIEVSSTVITENTEQDSDEGIEEITSVLRSTASLLDNPRTRSERLVKLRYALDAIERNDAITVSILDKSDSVARERLRTAAGTSDAMNAVVAGMGTQRKPDGWVGFTYEGGDATQDLFRCKACRKHFSVPVNGNPNEHHLCSVPRCDDHYDERGRQCVLHKYHDSPHEFGDDLEPYREPSLSSEVKT